MTLRYTLVTDGSSDRALLFVLDWLCRHHVQEAVEGHWFDPRPLARLPMSLQDRLLRGRKLYPCDVLFVHRDAEAQDPQNRYEEIAEAVKALAESGADVPHVCVVPVRMTEAWLLFDETAIRRAAGNPNGTVNLDLPPVERAEQLPDPKDMLITAIRTASDLAARRLKKLNVPQCRLRVAELIRDFTPLRRLPAFRRLEDDVAAFARTRGRG